MTDNTEPTIEELMKSLRPVLGMCDDDSCPSNCKKELKSARKLIKAYVADQVAKARIELLLKMLRDNHQKPIPEKYALELLKELRST